MIRFVQHQDIDSTAWDRAVLHSACPTVLATCRYLDLLADGSWDAIVEGDYQAVLPLPKRKKLGVAYVYTPFFLYRMGIFAPHPTDAATTAAFFKAIPKKFQAVDLLLNPDNDPSQLPSSPTLLTTHVLHLQPPYCEVADAFLSNTKRNIKSAEKHFLTVEKNEKNLTDIVQLFRNNRGRDRAVRFLEADYQRLEAVADRLLNENLLDVVAVRNREQNLIAGAFMLRDVDRIVFWFSGRDEQAAECKPMFFLMNEYLKEHCNQPTVFDFNGSSNPNVARFYQGFGGVPCSIPMVQYSRWYWRWWKALRQRTFHVL